MKFRQDYMCNEDRHYDIQVQAIMLNMIQSQAGKKHQY